MTVLLSWYSSLIDCYVYAFSLLLSMLFDPLEAHCSAFLLGHGYEYVFFLAFKFCPLPPLPSVDVSYTLPHYQPLDQPLNLLRIP